MNDEAKVTEEKKHFAVKDFTLCGVVNSLNLSNYTPENSSDGKTHDKLTVGLGVRESYTDKEGNPVWKNYSIVFWDQQAKDYSESLQKNQFVKITGDIEPQSYLNNDGKPVSALQLSGHKVVTYENTKTVENTVEDKEEELPFNDIEV